MNKNVIVEGKSIINHLVRYKKEEKQNTPNDVVFKFTHHIRELLSNFNPDHVAIIMPSESELSAHESGAINKIMMAMGVSTFSISSNLIGYHIQALKDKLPGELVISSISSSMLQLIDERTSVFRFDTQESVSPSSLQSLVGLTPSQIKDFIAMSGDPDFDIETIIGHKMSIDWLKSYGSIQGISQNSGKMNRAMKSLFDMKLNDILRQRAISDFTNIDGLSEEIQASASVRGSVDLDSLHKQFIDNKLYEWLPSDLREKHAPKTNLESEITYSIVIKSQADRDQFLSKIDKKKGISFYLSGNYASFSIEKGESYVISLSDSANIELIAKVLSDSELKIVTHDAKALMHWGSNLGFEVNNVVSDSAILAYTINTANKETQYKTLAKDLLGIDAKYSIKGATDEDNIRIAGEASDIILRLNRKLYELAIEDGRARYMFERLELPLIRTLFKMEKNGVNIDANGLKSFGSEIEQRMNEISRQVNAVSTEEINLGNSSHVSHFVFDILNAPEGTKKGSERSTSEESLLRLKDFHPVIPLISEYRKIEKLHSTYIRPYLELLSENQTRIFSSFLQNVAATSRLSCRAPNLQAIPIRSDDGRRIRKAFSAPDGSCIVAIDYSQIELRILAHLSQDKALMEAFNNGMDIHLATAAKVFNVDPEQVTGEQRRYAKAINFGIVYRMSPYGLAQKLGCTPEKASDFIDSYFQMFPGVKSFMDKTIKDAKKNGYTTTLFGRKFFYPEINSPDFKTRSSAERAAANSPMQGTASDIIKIAMNSIAHTLEKEELKTKMLMQVHDELVFEVPNEELEYVFGKMKNIMESAVPLSVPLIAEADVGKDWGSSHSLDQFKKSYESSIELN